MFVLSIIALAGQWATLQGRVLSPPLLSFPMLAMVLWTSVGGCPFDWVTYL